jgi:hypothetical protein
MANPFSDGLIGAGSNRAARTGGENRTPIALTLSKKGEKMSNMNKEEFQTYIRAELQKPRGPYDGVISIRPRGKYVGWLDEVIAEMGLEPNRGVCDKNFRAYWPLNEDTRSLDVVEEVVF